MKSLFDFQDTLKVVINGAPELVANTTEAQRSLHKDSKKKDYKASLCIKSTVNGVNFGLLMLSLRKRHGISLSNITKEVKMSKA